MNDLTSYLTLHGQSASTLGPQPGEAFFEPISGQWIGRDGEQPIADWIRGLPNTDAGLSTIDRWPGEASVDALVSRAVGEAQARVRTDHANLVAGGTGVMDALRAEGDSVRAGYALGSLAAAIEQRIAQHPGVPSETAARFAAELRERGAGMSFGAAREATANPEVFTFRGVCYASEDAMVGAVTRAMHEPDTTYARALTPEMERAGRIAEMDRAFWTAPRSPLGTTWAETGYMMARGHGAGPEALERAYALGAAGDALLGVAGAVAGAGAARSGFQIPGAQAGPLVTGSPNGAATFPTRSGAPAGQGPAVTVGPSRPDLPVATRPIGIGTAADLGISATLNPRQALHIPPVTDGRSVLTANPSELLRGLHEGAFTILRQPKPGQVVVDFGRPIGEYWAGGVRVGDTNFGSVAYGRNGAHIIPANPNQW